MSISRSASAERQAADAGAALQVLQARVDELQGAVEELLSHRSSQALVPLPPLPTLLSEPSDEAAPITERPAPAADVISPRPGAPATAGSGDSMDPILAPAPPVAAPRVSFSVSMEAAAQRAAGAAVDGSIVIADLADRVAGAEAGNAACGADVAGLVARMRDVDALLVEKAQEVGVAVFFRDPSYPNHNPDSAIITLK